MIWLKKIILLLSSHDISDCVKNAVYILKRKKNANKPCMGTVSNCLREEVFEVACYANLFLYKKLVRKVDGNQKSVRPLKVQAVQVY